MLAACKDPTLWSPGCHAFGNGCVRQVVPRTEPNKEANESEDDASEAHVGGGGGRWKRRPVRRGCRRRLRSGRFRERRLDDRPGGLGRDRRRGQGGRPPPEAPRRAPPERGQSPAAGKTD